MRRKPKRKNRMEDKNMKKKVKEKRKMWTTVEFILDTDLYPLFEWFTETPKQQHTNLSYKYSTWFLFICARHKHRVFINF